MKKNRLDRGGVWKRLRDRQEFATNAVLLAARSGPSLQLDTERRRLVPLFAEADQGGSADLGVGVEDRFARNRKPGV